MFEKVVVWLKGYLYVRLSGSQLERFINVCCYNNIFFYDVRYENDSVIACCRLKDLKELKRHLRKAGIKLRITKKRGLPFRLYALKKHIILPASILIFLFIVFLLSTRIWHIEVQGGFIHTPEQITGFLEKIEVAYGMAASKVDCSYVEAAIRKEYADISWVSCEKKGTNLIIMLKEAANYNVKDIAEAPEYGHIVAANDGIITEIITRKGTPRVSIGDVVKKGDILISGLVDVVADNSLIVDTHQVLADADIKYKTIIRYEDRIPLSYKSRIYSGKYKYNFDLSVLGVKIFAYYNRKLYNEYDIIKSMVSWKIFDEFYLPISHNIYKISEYTSQEMVYSEAEAKQEADKRLLSNLEKLSDSGIVILDYRIDGKLTRKEYIYSGYVIVIDDAGIYREITEEEYNEAIGKIAVPSE